jgi:transaldolase
LNSAAEGLGVEKFWEVPASVVQLVTLLNDKVPVTGDELVERVHNAGLGDMFPRLSADDKNRIKTEGKIPVLASWRDRILKGELAPDTLLTLAGLASFTADQKQLDDRITGIIGKV